MKLLTKNKGNHVLLWILALLVLSFAGCKKDELSRGAPVSFTIDLFLQGTGPIDDTDIQKVILLDGDSVLFKLKHARYFTEPYQYVYSIHPPAGSIYEYLRDTSIRYFGNPSFDIALHKKGVQIGTAIALPENLDWEPYHVTFPSAGMFIDHYNFLGNVTGTTVASGKDHYLVFRRKFTDHYTYFWIRIRLDDTFGIIQDYQFIDGKYAVDEIKTGM